jgi:hypothetical protein
MSEGGALMLGSREVEQYLNTWALTSCWAVFFPLCTPANGRSPYRVDVD